METKFNFKICTTKEQSERLLALGLKPETADMVLTEDSDGIWRPSLVFDDGEDDYDTSLYLEILPNEIPAWSLHRLVSVLTNNGINITFIANIVIIERYKVFEKSYEFWDDVYDNICDAYEWLIKEGYFNKEYLG